MATAVITLLHAAGTAEVPTETPYLVFGKGTGDHIVVGNHEAHKPGIGSYTWEFWTRLDGLATGWNLPIEFVGGDRYYVGFEAGAGWNFVVTSDGVRTDSRNDRYLPLGIGRWEFVQAVLDRSTQTQTLRIYDPTADSWRVAQVAPGTGSTVPTGTLYIPSPPSIWGFGGELQQMRFWSKARSTAEAESDMHLELVGNEADLAAYWPMNEAEGNTVFDLTANQHHGTIMGSPRWAGYWEHAFLPMAAPIALDFGQGVGQDDGERLLRNFQEKFSLTQDALRYASARADAPSSTALAVVENYLGRQNFVVETEVILNRFGGPGETRAGVAVLGGPHSGADPFDSVHDANFYGLTWVPAKDEATSLLEIRKGFRGNLLASVDWNGPSPVGGTDVPAGPDDEGVIFFEDFEDLPAAEAAWSRGGTTDIWAIGEPTGGPGSAHSGQNVAATGLGSGETYPANTDAWIRSPAIDLTAAEGFVGLSFWEYLDVDPEMDQDGFFHFTTVSVLDATDLGLIAELAIAAGHTDDWRLRRLQLPEEALGRQVIIEFHLHSDAFLGNVFEGWFIDDVAVAGLAPIRNHLRVEGDYRPTGALDLTFTMTAEGGHSQTLVATDPDPITAGNLFGIGGQLHGDGWEFDFLNFSLELGVRALPLTMAPANFSFGLADGRTGGESFFYNAPDDWSVTSDSLQLQPAAAGAYNSLAVTQVGNFQEGEPFFVRSRISLADFSTLDAGQRVGLVLFGDSDPLVFDPENDATFYSFQFIPGSGSGGAIALRQGMDGAIVAELAFDGLPNPPLVPSAGDPQAAIGVSYTFEFHGSYNLSGNLEFTGTLSDSAGGRAILSGEMANPPSGNHFGFGARHNGTGGPVWDVHSYDWINFDPVEMPFDFAFGLDAGRDSDENFFKAGLAPGDWNLEATSLRLARTFRSGAGLEVSGAMTSVINHSPGENFAIRSTVVPTLAEERPGFLRFNRGSDIINLGSPGALKPGADSFSWEFWTRVPAAAIGWNLAFEFTGGDRYYVGHNGTNGWNFVVTSNGTRTDSNAGGWLPLITDRWVFVQAVLDRQKSLQTLRLYDVAEDTWHEAQTIPGTGQTNPTGTLYFSTPTSNFWYQGDLHEFRFWRQARTRADAEADMHQALQGNEPQLEGYWPMNEGQGTVVLDQTFNGNHGNFAAGAAPEWKEFEAFGAPADVDLADLGGFVRLDGEDDYFTVPANDALKPGAGSYSWEFWARVDPGARDWNLPIEFPGGGGRYYIGYHGGGGWNFVVTSNGARRDTNADRWVAQVTGRWVFVQAVLDRGAELQTLRVYDPLEETWEQAQVVPAPGSTIPTGANLLISSGFRYRGDLQEIRFWNQVRTQADALNDMFAPLNGDESGLAAYWRMNQEGATVADLSGNGNHAITQGDPQWLSFEPSENLFGFGVAALGQGVRQGTLSSVFDSSFSFQWLPTVNKDGGMLVIGRPSADPGAPMVPIARLDLGNVPNAPRFETGGQYTLDLGGFYRDDGSLSLVGRLSDHLGREATLAQHIHQPDAYHPGDWFGMAGRVPEGATQLDWERFQMGTPEQLGIDPPVFDEATFDDWLSQHFTESERGDPTVSGPNANPIGDGIVNIIKYALGLDPWIPATGADLPQIASDGEVLVLIYPERHEPRDIDYLPEVSVDLAGWTGDGVTEINRELHPDLPGFDLVTVGATVPEAASRGFARLSIRRR